MSACQPCEEAKARRRGDADVMRARLDAISGLGRMRRAKLRMAIRDAELGLDSGGQAWDDIDAELEAAESSGAHGPVI